MRRFTVIAVAVAVCGALVGCATKQDTPEPTQTLRPTPPEIVAQYQSLLAGLDEDRPGSSVHSLQAFLEENGIYEIADTVRSDIDHYRTLAEGRYHEAREYARQGQFDRAERILQDIARYLPDTPDGAAARGHLEFDFYFGKAQWLLVRQRYTESAQVARSLLDRDLTPTQVDQVETILDNVGHVDASLAMAERSKAQAACRQLAVVLAQQYVEEGAYPSRFSLADAKARDPFGSRSIARALSSIEDYRASQDGYSFVAVSARGRYRIRVVDGNVQD
jgi:tetratricopeptide (TPR) repeat protein